MLNYSRFSISGRWNYGTFWERLLDNPQLPLPEWPEAREQITVLFKSLGKNLLPEVMRYMFINFRSFHPILLLPRESGIEHERRSHFTSLDYFFSFYKMIEREVDESLHPDGLTVVIGELPRLHALLEAITRILLKKQEETNSLDQLAASVQALGGWDKARTAVDAHIVASQGSIVDSVGAGLVQKGTIKHEECGNTEPGSSSINSSISEDSTRTSSSGDLSSCCSTLTDLQLISGISDFDETDESIRSYSSSPIESLVSTTSDDSSVKKSKLSLTYSGSYYEDIDPLASIKALAASSVPASLPTVSPSLFLCCMSLSRWELDLAWKPYSSCLEPKKQDPAMTKEKIDRVIEDCEKDNAAAFEEISNRFTPLEFSPMFDVIDTATLLDRNTTEKEEICLKKIIDEMNSSQESDIAAVFGEAPGEKRVAKRA